MAWSKVLELLVVSRLVAPGSEFRLHWQGFDQSAMGDRFECGFAAAQKDRLYCCLDRIVEHKTSLFGNLRERWQDLFQARFDVLLYEHVEGAGEVIPKAKSGYSRYQRFGYRKAVIALVVTQEGLCLAYVVAVGSRSDRVTLGEFLTKRSTVGAGESGWVMDRRIPSEEVLEEMRTWKREVFYVGGTPRVVLEKLATIPMLDVRFSTTHDRWRVMPRYTQREADQMLQLHELRLSLAPRPPPRTKLSEQVAAATSPLRV
ncbi:MAG TPA: hypothetical protein VFD30_17070 [Terriglobia bacterium]|nr:hypothetical protein [Terriglobia bacterium]